MSSQRSCSLGLEIVRVASVSMCEFRVRIFRNLINLSGCAHPLSARPKVVRKLNMQISRQKFHNVRTLMKSYVFWHPCRIVRPQHVELKIEICSESFVEICCSQLTHAMQWLSIWRSQFKKVCSDRQWCSIKTNWDSTVKLSKWSDLQEDYRSSNARSSKMNQQQLIRITVCY